MLKSLRAIEMMGGGNLKLTRLEGQFSRNLDIQHREVTSPFLRDHMVKLSEYFPLRLKAEADKDAKTVSQILKSVEEDGCPDVFITSAVALRPYSVYDQAKFKNRKINIPFIFHTHPFSPSVWKRLKSKTFPSFGTYLRLKEIIKNLSEDLDEDTKKRFRGNLLLNYPHQELSNQDIRAMWQNEPYAILFKERKGKFDLMEIEEV